jgi:hypothetical protein
MPYDGPFLLQLRIGIVPSVFQELSVRKGTLLALPVLYGPVLASSSPPSLALRYKVYSLFAMEYLTHLPKFQVIVCKKCQHAVLPSYIYAHFVAKPQHGLEKEERQRIIDAVAEIDGLISNNEALMFYNTRDAKPLLERAQAARRPANP